MKRRNIIILVILLLIVVLLLLIFSKNEKRTNNTPLEYKDKDYNIRLIKTVNSINDGNYLISPYSIELALNMLKVGANNNTLSEINSVISNRNIKLFNVNKRISVANASFIKDIYQDYINDSFYEKLKNYNAEILYDEFKNPNLINDWVKKNTYEMIPSILDKMDESFVLGIANAVAIDVEWQNKFECESTRSEEFTKTDGTKINVEMMHQDYDYNVKYFVNDDAKGIVIPYITYNEDGEYNKNGITLEFMGILPNTNPKEYIDNLSTLKLNEINDNMIEIKDNERLKLSLPRFSYEYNLKEFKDVLIKMGIKDVFNPDKADLTNIMSRSNMNTNNIQNLFVDEAIHKTYIDFNENGTKAAAITYFGIKEASMMPISKEEIVIKFNKPFIYMIRDKSTKEILFFGVVETPNKWNGSTCN